MNPLLHRPTKRDCLFLATHSKYGMPVRSWAGKIRSDCLFFCNVAVFAVGEPAPGVFKDFITTRNDGAILLQDNTSFVLVLYIKTTNSREIFSCQKHTIESAYYAEGPFWLEQIRFAENKKFIFDFPFNLAAYPKKERAERTQTIKASNNCSVVLINTTDALVHALRMVTIPPELHASLYRSCCEQMQVTVIPLKSYGALRGGQVYSGLSPTAGMENIQTRNKNERVKVFL